jgi:hypothetical protein
MGGTRQRALIGAGLATVASLAIAPAPASAAPPFFVDASKHRDGPYSNESPIPASVKPGQTKSFFWQASSSQDRALVLDDASTAEQDHQGLHIKWFRGRHNISSDVEGSGYEFTLKADKPKIFRTQIRATGHGDVCLIAHFEMPSVYSDTKAFAVNDDNACI